MTRISKLLCATLATFAVAGCASAPTCEDTNPSETGKVTGMSGKPLTSNPRASKCAQSKLGSDAEKITALNQGYESGLDIFCSEERAEKRGSAGLELGNLDQCGAERASSAKSAYERGIRVYCKPSNGFVIGSFGGTPARACEEQAWQDEFKRGQNVFMESKELDKSETDKVSL